MQLDDRGMRAELGINGIKFQRGGKCTITATLDDIERIARHMTRDTGWDLAPATIYACNKRARELRTFVAEQRAGKDVAGEP
jgi:hypothetical protein